MGRPRQACRTSLLFLIMVTQWFMFDELLMLLL
jgi:hypothetical protein